jgi:hypothetical protein
MEQQPKLEDLSDITKNILSFYNKKFDSLENELTQIEKIEGESGDKIAKEFDELLLCCNKEIKPTVQYEDPEKTFCAKNNKNDIRKIIFEGDLIGDKEFVKKVILYRKLEIKKQLVSLELDLVFLNYLVIHSINIEYARDIKEEQHIIGDMYKNVNLDNLSEEINESISELINYFRYLLLKNGRVKTVEELNNNQSFKQYENNTLCRYQTLSERANVLLVEK